MFAGESLVVDCQKVPEGARMGQEGMMDVGEG